MAFNNTGWRCRECLFNGMTVNCATATNMKSHIATHGYGHWRCTGCNYFGRRRETVTAHHRAAGETGVGSYLDLALNTRINQEVRECRLPHQNPWMGRTAVPPHHPAAPAANVATVPPAPPAPHALPAPVTAPPVPQPSSGQVYVKAKRVDYLHATNEEADALDTEVDWSSGTLTPVEASESPAPPMVSDGRATKLSLRTIKVRASAVASEHIAHLSNEDVEETYIVRAKAIDFLFHELYRMRTAFDHDNPASVIQKAIGSIIDILLWRRTLMSTAEDLEAMKVDLKAIRLLKKATKTAPLGDEPRAQCSN